MTLLCDSNTANMAGYMHQRPPMGTPMGGPMGVPMGAPMGVIAASPPPVCTLNAQDASLCLQLLEGGTVASPPCTGPFGFAWSGARGTVGVTGGRYRFSVTVLEQVLFEQSLPPQH